MWANVGQERFCSVIYIPSRGHGLVNPSLSLLLLLVLSGSNLSSRGEELARTRTGHGGFVFPRGSEDRRVTLRTLVSVAPAHEGGAACVSLVLRINRASLLCPLPATLPGRMCTPRAAMPRHPLHPGTLSRSSQLLHITSYTQKRKGNHYIPRFRLFQSSSNLFSYYYQKQLRSITLHPTGAS